MVLVLCFRGYLEPCYIFLLDEALMAFRERWSNKRANFRGIFNWLLALMCIKTVARLLGPIMPKFCHKHASTAEFNIPVGVVCVMYFLDLYWIINSKTSEMKPKISCFLNVLFKILFISEWKTKSRSYDYIRLRTGRA